MVAGPGFSGPGYDVGLAVGPGRRGFHRPRGSFPCDGTGFSWSDRVLDSVDALPGGDDLLGPGPVCSDLEGSAATAAHQAGGGVQEAVAQRLRLCPGEVAVQGEQLQPGHQDAAGHGGVEPGLVDLVVAGGYLLAVPVVYLWAAPVGCSVTYPAAYDLVTRLRAATGVAFSPHWFRHNVCDVAAAQGGGDGNRQGAPRPCVGRDDDRRVRAPDRRGRACRAGGSGLLHRPPASPGPGSTPRTTSARGLRHRRPGRCRRA